MKKFFVLLSALIIGASWVACGGKKEELPPTETGLNTQAEDLPIEPRFECVTVVNDTTPFVMKGLKLNGSQHPAHPNKKPNLYDVDTEFYLDELIHFTMDTDYDKFDEEKVMVFFLERRDFEEYSYMTYETFQSDAVIGQIVHAPDSEGYCLTIQPDSERMEAGAYDVFITYDGGTCYCLAVNLLPSLGLDPGELIDVGEPEPTEPVTEEEPTEPVDAAGDEPFTDEPSDNTDK